MVTATHLAIAMTFMGLDLPGFGSTEKEVRAAGFLDAHSDMSAWYESQTLARTMRSKLLGKVRVHAVTYKGIVHSLSVACIGTRLCARRSPTAADGCRRITRTSWRCSQSGAQFDVRSCGEFVYFLILPGAEFPDAACSSLTAARGARGMHTSLA